MIRQHIHDGEFIAKFPLIPGHETVGVIAAVGKARISLDNLNQQTLTTAEQDVKGFQIGDRVAADNSELCNECFYCRRGQLLLCENVGRLDHRPSAMLMNLVQRPRCHHERRLRRVLRLPSSQGLQDPEPGLG